MAHYSLSVADLARFVDLFVGQAEVGNAYCFWFRSGALIRPANFPTFLHSVVFVRKTYLRAALDQQRVSLNALILRARTW